MSHRALLSHVQSPRENAFLLLAVDDPITDDVLKKVQALSHVMQAKALSF